MSMIFIPFPCTHHQVYILRAIQRHICATVNEWPDIRICELIFLQQLVSDLDQFFSFILEGDTNKCAAFL